MSTITPNQSVALPVTGGLFPGNLGQPQSGETWDLVYCPTGQFVDFTYDIASDTQPRGSSVVYDSTANTLTVTMATLAALQSFDPGAQYGTWVALYDTQPGANHVAGAGRSAYFAFAATPPLTAPQPAPVLAASVQPGGVLLQCTVPSS